MMISNEQLVLILNKHKLWLEGKDGGEKADLRYAKLSCANLSDANLSGIKGLLNSIDYLKDNFEKTDRGYIVYKSFGMYYTIPNKWEIKKRFNY